MLSNFEKFKRLHHAGSLFVLPNAWNAKSALFFQENNFSAIATSSAAVASSLGYEDGEKMPFADYLFIVKRIVSRVQIPVSVDIETGYGKSNEDIYTNVRKLIDLGVVGINIEDSIINKSGRSLQDEKIFAATIEYIKNKLVAEKLDLFINIRCDTYILDVANKKQETNKRLKVYGSSGADGIFLPCILTEEDIAEAIAHTKLPLNVMCMPALPDFKTLNKLGVKRASMGPFLFNKVYEHIHNYTQAITTTDSFSPIIG